jgi:hypothetical protein
MEPSIRRAIGTGFKTASRSWAAIGFYAGVLLAVMAVSFMAIAATQPPSPQAGLDDALTAPPIAAPGAEDAASLETPAPETPAVAPEADSPAAEAGDVNLFNQLESTEPPPAEAPVEPEPLFPTAGIDADADAQARALSEWSSRVWPLLIFLLLVVVLVNVWLTGGQIGYMGARVSGQSAPLSLFWREASQSFVRLLAAWGLLLVVALPVGALTGFLVSALPEGLGTFLMLIIRLAFVAISAWLSFWFIAVVVDRLGPIAGLKAGFSIGSRHWVKTVGLGFLVGLIFIAVSLLVNLVTAGTMIIGGGLAGIFLLLGVVVGFLASFYVTFASIASFIRFYQDAKSLPAAT